MPSVPWPTRRAMLAGMGAIAAGGSAALPTSALPIPEVDALEVLFLVDGATFAFAEPVRTADLTVDPAPRSFEPHQATLAAEFGLSLLVRSRLGSTARTSLIDFGYTPAALANNARLLGVDMASVDAAVLSHGHYDHFGGMPAALGPGGLRRGVPLHVGGEEAFCERLRLAANGSTASFGRIDRRAITAAGVRLVVSDQPRLVADHGLATGRIPLAGDERAAIPTRMRPGQGCERAALPSDRRDLEVFADDGDHELGAAWRVRGKGLVVFGSCSHRGILNTIRRAQALTGDRRLHAVIGGFHLVAPRTRAEALATAAELRIMAPDYLVPGHCSGEPFIAEATRLMGPRVIRPYVGSRFTFAPRA